MAFAFAARGVVGAVDPRAVWRVVQNHRLGATRASVGVLDVADGGEQLGGSNLLEPVVQVVSSEPELATPLTNVIAHRRPYDHHPVLLREPISDPLRRVTLLTRRVPISDQDLIDPLPPRTRLRLGPRASPPSNPASVNCPAGALGSSPEQPRRAPSSGTGAFPLLLMQSVNYTVPTPAETTITPFICCDVDPLFHRRTGANSDRRTHGDSCVRGSRSCSPAEASPD